MEDSPTNTIGTINCLLCGGVQIYPGPRYKNHLINEHGAIFEVDFLIKLSIIKKEKGSLPECSGDHEKSRKEVKESSSDTKTETVSIETQTDLEPERNNDPCLKCMSPVSDEKEKILPGPEEDSEDNLENDDFDDNYEDVTGNLVMDMEEEDHEINLDGSAQIKAWICPSCPHVYQREELFKAHVSSLHDLKDSDIGAIEHVSMTMEDFWRHKEKADSHDEEAEAKAEEMVVEGPTESQKSPNVTTNFQLDRNKRKPVGKEWGKHSFSSTFTCYFCNEQFRKDYRLKLHLMLNHKTESPEEMAKAKEVLTKAKLDGCVHRCALCGSKYNSIANFTRHVKDVHSITRAQYRTQYGSSEVISRMFKCELCDKEVKHTRNIIGAHMKMVHLISWKEYQEILIKIRQGETVGDLPAPELFECMICGVSVKYKREHLNKKHQITNDVYDELISKKNRGEDISNVLPTREIHKCLICERECMDIKKHIERSHQITEATYEELVASKGFKGSKKLAKALTGNDFEEKLPLPPHLRQSFEMVPTADSESSGTASPNNFHGNLLLLSGNSANLSGNSGNLSGNSGNVSGSLSTDLQCYFGCEESFKKDYQLHLHLKLKHRNEDQDELSKAYEAAEEEIALTRRSASIFNCALCPKTFTDNGAFYGHIQVINYSIIKFIFFMLDRGKIL